MTLDVWLVGRLARELDELLRGARIQWVKSTPLGLTVACHRRGGPIALVASLDPEGPILAAVAGGPQEHESGAGGWAGSVAALLRNATIETVQAVPHDRIVNVDVTSRSAFGVPARHRLVFELEPRKANALVLRPSDGGGFSVLAVAKTIEGADGARDVAAGRPYEPPPSRGIFRSIPDQSLRTFDGAPTDLVDVRTIARKLADLDPACSPPLAREAIERASLRDDGRPLLNRAVTAWSHLRLEVERAASDPSAPIYAYIRNGAIGACHCVPLTWAPGTLDLRRSLNDVCIDQLALALRRRSAPVANSLRKRLGVMLGRCADEMARLRAAQQAGVDADALRLAGDAIYANLSAIAPRAESFTTSDGTVVALEPDLDPKENAQRYFRRFRKARSGLPRVAERLTVLEANRAFWEQMLWEVDRADAAADGDPTAFDEIADSIGVRRGGHAPKSKTARPGAPRTRAVALPSGAIAHVGRSPKDNERVTFSLAGPDDLWFHARGIPGAHVIIRSAGGRNAPTEDDILAAAALAAGQSRAADSAKVEVDYTRRKHVRKQGGGRPGLVWYTDFKTILVAPQKL